MSTSKILNNPSAIQDYTLPTRPDFPLDENTTFVILDVETTGFPDDWNAHPSKLKVQPHIVQVAYWIQQADTIFDKDLDFLSYENSELVLLPTGVKVGASAKVHGKTDEMLAKSGKPITKVISDLYNYIQEERSVGQKIILICHNIEFDYKMLAAECYRNDISLEAIRFDGGFCTMKSLTEYTKLYPMRYGNYKWPSLAQLYYHIFNKDMENAHDAGGDVKATKDSFFHLMNDREDYKYLPKWLQEISIVNYDKHFDKTNETDSSNQFKD